MRPGDTAPPGWRQTEAQMDADWQLEIAAEPVAAELLDVVSEAALAYLADLSDTEKHKADKWLRKDVRYWSQCCAETLLEARARNAEPVGGWES